MFTDECNILCKLGIHKYREVESQSLHNIIKDIYDCNFSHINDCLEEQSFLLKLFDSRPGFLYSDNTYVIKWYIDNGCPIYDGVSDGSITYELKVCLRCGKVVNEIREVKLKIINKLLRKRYDKRIKFEVEQQEAMRIYKSIKGGYK